MRRIKDKEKIEKIFEAMFELRNRIAHTAGFSNFTDYQFKAYHRFDYTPKDCKKFHETVEKLIVPLNGRILNRRREQMKFKSLRPWDTAVDALGKKPLPLFKDDTGIDQVVLQFLINWTAISAFNSRKLTWAFWAGPAVKAKLLEVIKHLK